MSRCVSRLAGRADVPPGRGRALPWVLLVLLACAGCQATQRQAKQQAANRWNTVRAQVKAQLAADQLAAGNVDDAAGELARAYGLDPTIPELVPLQARVHLAKGEVHKAQRLLESTSVQGSARAEADYLLGIVWQHHQRWDTALEHFGRASRANPDEIAYFVAVVQAMLQLGRAEEAQEWLRSGEQAFGWTSAYQAAWAECHEQLGEWDAAAAAWARVAGSADADVGVRERLAAALYRAGRLSEATPVLRELFDGNRSEPSDCLRLALADCLLEDGRSEEAHAQVIVVLRQDERNAAAWRLLARVLAAQRRFDGALRAAQRALEFDGDDARSLELAAALAHRSGHRELAAGLATRLLECAPDNESEVARLILAASAHAAGQSAPTARAQEE